MANILSILKANDYRIDIEDLNTLIKSVTSADRVGAKLTDGYFNVLQRKFVDAISAGQPDKNECLKQAHEVLYARVKAIVEAEPDVMDSKMDTSEERTEKARERNRRCNFARTARQSIADALKLGIAVPEWDRGELVTKASLIQGVIDERVTVAETPEQKLRNIEAMYVRQLLIVAATNDMEAKAQVTVFAAGLTAWAAGV